jgi:hypothetical protein
VPLARRRGNVRNNRFGFGFGFGFGLSDFALAFARRSLLRKRFGCFALAQASAFC